jgi:hypothetical protein
VTEKKRERQHFEDAAWRDRTAALRRQQRHDIWFWLMYAVVVGVSVIIIARSI